MPYVEKNSIKFNGARSAGCWTLPATTSLFTGLMPHQHEATSQTRSFREDAVTLAENMRKAGYSTHQVTGNPVTTDIFGLDRGFDDVVQIWQHVDATHKSLLRFVLMVMRPRIRKLMFSKDFVMDKLTSDMRVGICWAQNTYTEIFDHTKQIIKENEAKGKPSFIFINLMESHFPYHVAPTFEFNSKGIVNKVKESYGLFNTINQAFLTKEKNPLYGDTQKTIRDRQYKAWDILHQPINDFVKELHEGKENLVVFCSDHGDNFGDQNWVYHFSNVTDGGNKIPLFWLPHDGRAPKEINTPVSGRFIQNDILRACGIGHEGGSLFDEDARSMPILQSFWYNNQGNTMDKFLYNQIAFIEGDQRYVYRDNKNRDFSWLTAPVGKNGEEPHFEPMEKGYSPLEEKVVDLERRAYLKKTFQDFEDFSNNIKK